MTESLSLNGDSKLVLNTLLDVISDSTSDPYYHISEIVQNELDAEATEINITFLRRGGTKKGELRKIVIEGNGWGFLESFEHYSTNMCDSIKNKNREYRDRKDKGQSRGQFCLGLQGFRAIFKELHIINLTKPGMRPKADGDITIVDPDFDKMFTNRKMILHDNTIKYEIKNEGEFEETRDTHGVTCILIDPIQPIKSDKLVKFLSHNKRPELISNKNLRITVKDYSYEKKVVPIDFKGEKFVFKATHPKADSSSKYRGLGEVKATLHFHEEKPGRNIVLYVNKEPIVRDISTLPELDKSPWNSDCIEGYIEYDLLSKSPTRTGVKRDDVFFPAFIEITKVLENDVKKKLKEYEVKTKSKQDKDLNKKLNEVFGEIKRVLDKDTWFDKPVKKAQIGPLEYIKVFPELANIPIYTTRRFHAIAHDEEDKVLKESNSIQFDWEVSNDLGTMIPKKDGVAIFKASSKVGPTSVEVKVIDLETKKELTETIQIAITLPHKVGPMARVRIEPTVSTIAFGEEREFRAIAEDDERNIISDKNVKYSWEILIDETNGATLSNDYSESVILTPGKTIGSIKIQVTARQGSLKASDFALITITESSKKPGRKPPIKSAGHPEPEPYHDPYEYQIKHCYITEKGTTLRYNTGHPDYIHAQSKGQKFRQRYIATLYAKEWAKKEHIATGKDYGELFLDFLSKIDRFW